MAQVANNEILASEMETEYIVNHGTPPDGQPTRNFFILIDGTWNNALGEDGDQVVTNIRKLYECIGPDSPKQITRYFRGVGNSEDYGRIKRLFYGLTGDDEKRIRASIYAAIAKEYRPGDNLFLLGFSRGAACARRVASLLAIEKGIPETILIRTEYAANRITRQVENRFLKYFPVKGPNRPVAIRFLGCFDTVGAFILPMRFPNYPVLDKVFNFFRNWLSRLKGEIPFSNLTLAENVERAVHCVAIDETRVAFCPTLMSAEPRVEEVWFPGVHSDVGGGYASDALGRISLAFMIKRMEAFIAGSKLQTIDWNRELLQKYTEEKPDEFYDFHFHGLKRGLSLAGKLIRKIRVHSDSGDKDQVLRPKIHTSVRMLWESNRVRAEVECRKKKWPILYSPYNIRALNQEKSSIDADKSSWPFEWVE